MAPLYELFTTTGSAIVLPALLLRAAGSPERRRGLAERLGRLPSWPGAPGVWLQAVSAGEVRVARTFLEGLRPLCPSLPVALSATTDAGRAMARTAGADMVFTFPLDAPWIVRRALASLAPVAFGTVETEIWPALLRACAARSIPAFMVSGTLSERSTRRWRALASRAAREGLAALRAACMQRQEDAERILRLGAPEAAVEVTGDLKFDALQPPGAAPTHQLREALHLGEAAPVIVAGSTSEGEEALVLDAWREARRSIPSLILIVAPRHPRRFDAVEAAIRATGAALRRRSRSGAGGQAGASEVILLDTLGELEAAYGLGQVAFVGGSLVPRGGQNPLEPARLGVPALFGPGMDNFRDVADRLVECGAAFEVAAPSDLARAIVRLISDSAARERASRAGLEFTERHRGAVGRTTEALRRLIPEVFA